MLYVILATIEKKIEQCGKHHGDDYYYENTEAQ
jgi:hypothetical protein